MVIEAVPGEMYEALLGLDSQIHTVLEQWKPKEKISLRELGEHIAKFLAEEVPETTTLLREMREKRYA